MTTLTVWKFDSATGAEGTVHDLQRMQREELIKIVDAAYVTWPEGTKKPKTEQLNNLAGAGAMGEHAIRTQRKTKDLCWRRPGGDTAAAGLHSVS